MNNKTIIEFGFFYRMKNYGDLGQCCSRNAWHSSYISWFCYQSVTKWHLSIFHDFKLKSVGKKLSKKQKRLFET